MSDPHRDDLIAKAAERAGERPFYLGSTIAAFQGMRHMDDRDLTVLLGCSSGTLARLRLCRRPDVASDRFGSDVRQIAQRFEVDAPTLLQLIREVSSIEVMRQSHAEVATGFLMAARDKSRRRRGDKKKKDE